LLGEKLSLRSILSLVFSFFGVVLISSQGNPMALEIKSPLGVVLALSSSIAWAFYWILNLRNSKIDTVIRLFLNFFFATIYALIVTIFFPDFWDFNMKGILGSLYVGFFEMGITFVIWLKALTLTESKAKLNNIIYLVPFVSLLFIHFFVGETIYWTTFVGLCVIVGSILFQQLKSVKI
jgi:drug/metabolite transporter (DMT)-like permease